MARLAAIARPRDAEFVFEDDGQAAAILLVNAAMLRITRRRAHPKIWIDDALGGATPCRRSALRQRGEVTFDAIPEYAVGLHADRVARSIRLRPNRGGQKTVAVIKTAQTGARIIMSPRYDVA